MAAELVAEAVPIAGAIEKEVVVKEAPSNETMEVDGLAAQANPDMYDSLAKVCLASPDAGRAAIAAAKMPRPGSCVYSEELGVQLEDMARLSSLSSHRWMLTSRVLLSGISSIEWR